MWQTYPMQDRVQMCGKVLTSGVAFVDIVYAMCGSGSCERYYFTEILLIIERGEVLGDGVSWQKNVSCSYFIFKSG